MYRSRVMASLRLGAPVMAGIALLAACSGGGSVAASPSESPAASPGAPGGTSAGGVQVAGLGVADLAGLLDRGATTSVELVRAYTERIRAYDTDRRDKKGVNSVLTLNRRASAEAAELDAERRSGRVRGPLHGVPVVVKDNIDTGDLPTTSGSTALKGLVPPGDATQVARLRAAGAIVLAKTNLHEFAMNIYTVSSLGGQTRNPYDLTRHPGGSSGGTGAAVAAAFAPVGIGTDTCGSVRIPAAHTNLVGLRPTMGLSSRGGIAPLAGTQDVPGPMGVSVRDVALVLQATAGPDPRDPATRAAEGKVPDDYTRGLTPNALRGKRIGVFTDYFTASGRAERATDELVRKAVADMAAHGATTVRLPAQPEIMAAAAGANRVSHEFERDLDRYLASSAKGRLPELAKLKPPRDRVTLADIAASGKVAPGVLSTLRSWTGSPALPNPEYRNRLRQRDVLRARLNTLMRERRLDALVYPTISAPPTRIGETQSYLNCRLAGYSGYPALTVPAGFTAQGLPVGVELLGGPFSEPTLLAMGYAYEQATRHRTLPKGMPALR